MTGLIIIAILAVGIVLRRVLLQRSETKTAVSSSPKQSSRKIGPVEQQLRTIGVFTKLSTRRFFRDRLALFFGILFPLIFLFVFGGLSSGNSGNVSFSVALLNESNTPFSKTLANEITGSKVFKVDKSLTSLSAAEGKMSKSQIDGIIVLPKGFGASQASQSYPSGHAEVLYDESTSGTGQTLTSVLQQTLNGINSKFVKTTLPLSVTGQELNSKSLTAFDYTFSGLLGFSIIGMGIFGPVNVFPELKKQGILRRLHTTPLRVWQYFLATMFSQAITGLVSIAIQFVVAIEVFHLKIDGNYPEIILFTIFSIFMILGIGLAIGGWAKNERQAAPLSNIIVFPMLFLSGTFFPRFEMPVWLQHVTTFLPLTPVIDGLRQLTTEGKSLFQIGPQIGLVAAWMVVVYIVAFAVFKWE